MLSAGEKRESGPEALKGYRTRIMGRKWIRETIVKPQLFGSDG